MSSLERVFGIDLGTTYSCIAYVDEFGKPITVQNAETERITPSVVFFDGPNVVVGGVAKASAKLYPLAVVELVKRSMGDPNDLFEHDGRTYRAEEISAFILRKVVGDAEMALGEPSRDVVITIPAYFGVNEREATARAGQIAGLRVWQIINEPTAAAIAYGMDRAEDQVVLVYDLGGGTFDVTMIEIKSRSITVLCTGGDQNLGVKDWDGRIAAFVGRRFADRHGVDPLDDHAAFDDLLVRAEAAKKTLSTRDATRITVHHDGRRETIEFARATFEDLTRDLLERTEVLREQVLEDAGLAWGDLTGVLLVGGSSRMPMVHDYVRRVSGKAPIAGVNVDEAVALGASILAARILADAGPGEAAAAFGLAAPRRTHDVTSHSLGMIAVSPDRTRYLNSVILPRNRPVPHEVTRPYQLPTGARRKNELEIYMTQGEGDDPAACSFLGRYRVGEVAHDPSGTAVIDIAYAYDANGIVRVSARERSSGRALPMEVEPVPPDMSWLRRPPEAAAEHQHLTAYLVFDLSGSMSGEPLAEAREAAREFVRQCDLAHNSIGLISFADGVATDLEASQNARHLDRAIAGLSIGDVGYGTSASPFAHARGLLAATEGPRFLVVLTDGIWSDQDLAIDEARACRRDGIEIIAIGFGGADRGFLAAIASSERASFFARAGELVSTFGTIAQELTEGAGALGRGLRFS